MSQVTSVLLASVSAEASCSLGRGLNLSYLGEHTQECDSQLSSHSSSTSPRNWSSYQSGAGISVLSSSSAWGKGCGPGRGVVGSLAVIDPHTHSHPMGESFSFIAERSRKPQREMGRGKAFWKFPVPSLQGGQASTNLSHMTQAVTELSLG